MNQANLIGISGKGSKRLEPWIILDIYAQVTVSTRESHLKEKDLQYYEDLEKKEEEKIQKRNERKQKREEKRNVSIIKPSISVCVDSTVESTSYFVSRRDFDFCTCNGS